MSQPVLIGSGLPGWQFLKQTEARQLETFSRTGQVRNDTAHFEKTFAQPVALDTFLSDSRLMRVALGAFDLGAEFWKRGFIEKVLTESQDPESTFLTRLNNPDYSAFAEALKPVDGVITLNAGARDALMTRYRESAFREAVGQTDDVMRRALNFEASIGRVLGGGSDETVLAFRALGSLPIRSVLETALSLPSEFSKLPVERQASELQDRLRTRLGIDSLTRLREPETAQAVVRRFLVISEAQSGFSASSSQSIALTLLGGQGGLGAGASRNLFLSGLGG